MIVEGDEKMDDIILVQPVRIIQQDSSVYGDSGLSAGISGKGGQY